MRPIYDTDLIKQINKHLIGIDPETHESLISTKDIARIIMETPTANIEPKQGHVIKTWGCEEKCSECGGVVFSEWNYCPWCGAWRG